MSRKRLQRWKNGIESGAMKPVLVEPKGDRQSSPRSDALVAGRALATAAESYLDAFNNGADFAAAARTLRSAIERFRNADQREQ